LRPVLPITSQPSLATMGPDLSDRARADRVYGPGVALPP
jgi:hypothetical protein